MGGRGSLRSVGGYASGVRCAGGGSLQVRPRPSPRSSLLTDPGTTTRRGPPANREAAQCAHSIREAGGGYLRNRQSTQSRGGLDYLTRGTRPDRRVKPNRRPTRQSFDGLHLSVELSDCGCVITGRRLLGTPA